MYSKVKNTQQSIWINFKWAKCKCIYNINTSIRWVYCKVYSQKKIEYYDFKPDLNPKIKVWTRTRPDPTRHNHMRVGSGSGRVCTPLVWMWCFWKNDSIKTSIPGYGGNEGVPKINGKDEGACSSFLPGVIERSDIMCLCYLFFSNGSPSGKSALTGTSSMLKSSTRVTSQSIDSIQSSL